MHLDADTVRGLSAGTLAAAARTAADAHVAECAACRTRVADIALLETAIATPAPAPSSASDDKARAITLGPPSEDIALLATVAPTSPGSRPISAAEAGVLETMASPQPTGAAFLASGEPTRNLRPPSGGPAVRDQMIGRYRILDRLGSGGMGVVYLAEDPQLARKVAVKLLHQPDPALTERLVREARAMAKVSHPNVVGVFEVGVATDGATYIAMELVNGSGLREWQATRRSVADVIETYVAAGHGLAAAHAAGIIHRDFKPDNVLVGDDHRVRVTDFGLAAAGVVATRSTGSKGVAAITGALELDGVGTLTMAGSVLGTPAYMAPEQFENGNLDSRTDQFSFCVALYEALYGERPFAGKTYLELAEAVREGRVRAAPAGSRVSRALRQIVVRGLSVRPGDRFPTMDHLLEQLGRDRARPWRRAALVATVIAAVLGGGGIADWIVRDRAVTTTRIAFADTGRQFDRAVRLLDKSVDAMSNRALVEPALRVVSGNYDDADFGLGTETDDTDKRTKLHELLVSADLVAFGKATSGVLAIADKKGRLLYTGAAPSAWGGDLTALPSVKRALDNVEADSMTLVRADDPTVVAAKLLGPNPAHKSWVLFTRALVLGGSVGALYLQLVDGNAVLDDVRLDEDTQLALVAPDGTAVGDVQDALLAAARDGIAEVTRGGTTYQVQSLPMRDLDGKTVIAQFVMARPLPGVLSLFPGARTVFALATLAMLLLAGATALRARQISGARV